MNPEHVLNAEAVKCGECEKPMLLLVQVRQCDLICLFGGCFVNL